MPTRNLLIVCYWPFNDALVQSAIIPYVRQMNATLGPGSKIYIFTVEAVTAKPADPEVVRRQLEPLNAEWLHLDNYKLGMKNMLRLVFRMFQMAWFVRRHKIEAIHAWCMNGGLLGYITSKFSGRPLVIDSFEPEAQNRVETGVWKAGSRLHRIFSWFERRQVRRAAGFVSCTDGYLDAASQEFGRNLRAEAACYVKAACVNLTLFDPSNRKLPDVMAELGLTHQNIVCVYAGKFGGIYLENETYDFFRACYDYWGERFRVVLLTAHTDEDIDAGCAAAALPRHVILKRFLPHHEVPRYMGVGDFGICPVKMTPTKRYCSPIKNGEYWALGLPVVIPTGISDDFEIIAANNAGAVLPTLDRPAYDAAIRQIDTLLTTEPRDQLTSRIRQLAVRYRNLDEAAQIYQDLYGPKSSIGLHG